jgi:hypothetical protein
MNESEESDLGTLCEVVSRTGQRDTRGSGVATADP